VTKKDRASYRFGKRPDHEVEGSESVKIGAGTGSRGCWTAVHGGGRTRGGLASRGVAPAVLSGAATGHDRVRDGTGWVRRAPGHGSAHHPGPAPRHPRDPVPAPIFTRSLLCARRAARPRAALQRAARDGRCVCARDRPGAGVRPSSTATHPSHVAPIHAVAGAAVPRPRPSAAPARSPPPPAAPAAGHHWCPGGNGARGPRDLIRCRPRP
jgi:hypothetical protein